MGGLARHQQQILDSVVNVVPVLMPYASALFNRRAVGDRPLVVPKRSKNLAFISQFAELPKARWAGWPCALRRCGTRPADG